MPAINVVAKLPKEKPTEGSQKSKSGKTSDFSDIVAAILATGSNDEVLTSKTEVKSELNQIVSVAAKSINTKIPNLPVASASTKETDTGSVQEVKGKSEGNVSPNSMIGQSGKLVSTLQQLTTESGQLVSSQPTNGLQQPSKQATINNQAPISQAELKSVISTGNVPAALPETVENVDKALLKSKNPQMTPVQSGSYPQQILSAKGTSPTVVQTENETKAEISFFKPAAQSAASGNATTGLTGSSGPPGTALPFHTMDAAAVNNPKVVPTGKNQLSEVPKLEIQHIIGQNMPALPDANALQPNNVLKLPSDIKQAGTTLVQFFKEQVHPVLQNSLRQLSYSSGPEVKSFSIKLVPEHLGNIEIKVSLDNGELNAHFTVANGQVGNLLNSQLDNLRAALLGQGLSLGQLDVNIQQESRQGTQANQKQTTNKRFDFGEEEVQPVDYGIQVDPGKVLDLLA